MLPLPYRLPSWEIPLVLRSGRRMNSKNFQLVYCRSVNSSLGRFAVVVPGRLDKRAVVRNRNKRLVRESIQHLRTELSGGWDRVIVVKRSVAELKQPIVEEEIRGLLLP